MPQPSPRRHGRSAWHNDGSTHQSKKLVEHVAFVIDVAFAKTSGQDVVFKIHCQVGDGIAAGQSRPFICRRPPSAPSAPRSPSAPRYRAHRAAPDNADRAETGQWPTTAVALTAQLKALLKEGRSEQGVIAASFLDAQELDQLAHARAEGHEKAAMMALIKEGRHLRGGHLCTRARPCSSGITLQAKTAANQEGAGPAEAEAAAVLRAGRLGSGGLCALLPHQRLAKQCIQGAAAFADEADGP